MMKQKETKTKGKNYFSIKKNTKGITLIALVITIIIPS